MAFNGADGVCDHAHVSHHLLVKIASGIQMELFISQSVQREIVFVHFSLIEVNVPPRERCMNECKQKEIRMCILTVIFAH